MTSPDGINWTSRASAADNSWQGVTYGNGLFVAVSNDGSGNRVMTSPDGINWTSRASAADNWWLSVTYGNGIFVAVSWSGTGNRVMYSGKPETSTIQNNNLLQGGLSVNGFVGLGTSTPYANFALSIPYAGNSNTTVFAISSSSATTTSAQTSLYTISNTGSTTASNGFNIVSGCYAINGTCLATGAGTFGTTSIDTSAKIAAIVSDETGGGTLVFSSGATLTGTTLNGTTTLVNATSTTFFSGIASSTNLFATNANLTNGTSSTWFSGIGSSTSFFAGNSYIKNATSTTQYISGNLSIGSTSPYAKLSIQAVAGETGTTLFAIGSSTVGSPTSNTLFSISNTGNVNLANSAALSFGSLYGSGTTGYGLRENGGMIEFKNAYASSTPLASGWTSIASAASVRYQMNETGWVDTGATFPVSMRFSSNVIVGDYAYFLGGNVGGSQPIVFSAHRSQVPPAGLIQVLPYQPSLLIRKLS